MPNAILASRTLGLRLSGMLTFVACLLHPLAGLQAFAQVPAVTSTSAPSPRLNPLPRISNTLQIGPGDLLDVEVFNTPELSGKQQVSQSGKIRLAGTGEIGVEGMTPLEAAAQIERRLKSGEVMLEPQVTVLVQEHANREVSVLGEVNRPGTYQLQGWPSLASAIAAAGGGSPKQGSTISITHRGDPDHPEVVRLDGSPSDRNQAGILLQASDVVVVSQAGLIYVVGDVTKPGQFSLTNGRPLTALEALAMAEGLKDNARPDKASIIRNHGQTAEMIPVNLSRVEKNLSPDPALEPFDILVVPHSGFKQFELSVLPSLTGAAANAIALALTNR